MYFPIFAPARIQENIPGDNLCIGFVPGCNFRFVGALLLLAQNQESTNKPLVPLSLCESAAKRSYNTSAEVPSDKACNPPGLLQESLRPFGPEVSRECPSGCLWGPSGPRDTLRDTPGTLRARRLL